MMDESRQTKDWEDRCFVALYAIAERLGAQAIDMLSVMFSESGAKSTAHNPNGDASGLIQFMPRTLIGLGWRKGDAAFRRLSVYDQLAYVEKYYKSYVGHLDSVGGLYVATFLPAFVKFAGDPDYELVVKNGKDPDKLAWAYDPNASFDYNHDKKITVSELEDAVIRNCRGTRWDQLVARLNPDSKCDELSTKELPDTLDNE